MSQSHTHEEASHLQMAVEWPTLGEDGSARRERPSQTDAWLPAARCLASSFWLPAKLVDTWMYNSWRARKLACVRVVPVGSSPFL